MKYLSILKDSFREAIDSKILYVTVTLSCLLFLFLASISFRPVSMKEEVEDTADKINFVANLQSQGKPKDQRISCEVANFEQLNDASEPWLGDYRFTFMLHLPKHVPGQAEPVVKLLSDGTKERFWYLKDIRIKQTRSEEQNELRLLVTSHGTRIETERSWTHEPALFFGALPLPWLRMSLGYGVYWLENRLVNTIGGWVIVLLGVVVTASFIPNMLRKGTVDLLLSKPISRPGLLTFKYLGGLTFIFLNTAFTILGVWLILGLRTGVWTAGFLVSILVLTFFFAILYAVSTLSAVLTRSTVVCILVTLFAWAVVWVLGLVYDWMHPLRALALPQERATAQAPKQPADGAERPPAPPRPVVPEWLSLSVAVAHAILPRTSDLGHLSTHLISSEVLSESERQHFHFEEEGGSGWGESLGVSAAFIVVVLGLSCWFFVLKDY